MRLFSTESKTLNKLTFTLYAFAVISALVFIWTNRFLPLQDYPDWLFQGYVFSGFLRGEPIEGYKLGNYSTPNLLCTILMGFTDLFLSPEASGKVFLSLYVLIFAIGSIYFFGSTRADLGHPLVLVPALLILNDMFWFGFLNQILGLGLLFLAMGYLGSRILREQPVNYWIVLAFSLLIYFSHAICYASFVILILSIALIQRRRTHLPCLILPLVPSLALMTIYLVNRTQSGLRVIAADRGPWTLTKHMIYKASTGISAVSIFTRFYPYFDFRSGVTMGLATINLAFTVGIAMAFLIWLSQMAFRKRKQDGGNAALLECFSRASIGYLIIFAVSPCNVAQVVDPGQRFIYPALWLALSMLASKPNPLKISPSPPDNKIEKSQCSQRGKLVAKVLKVVLVILLVVQAMYLHTYVRHISKDMNRLWEAMKSVDLGNEFDVIYEHIFDYEEEFNQSLTNLRLLRLPSHSPLDRIHYYLSIEKRAHARIFQTGMLLDTKSLPPMQSISSIRSMNYFPEKIMIVGEAKGIRFIARQLEPRYQIEKEEDFLVVLSRVGSY